jgi:branched-subunit amino acid transport protein
MTAMILAVAGLAVLNFAFKAVGPALIGDRAFPPRVQDVVDALPAALLAGLLVVDLVGDHWKDADWTMLPGLAAAGALAAARAPQLVCIIAGVAVTAAVRALT